MGGAASCRMYASENDMKALPECDIFLKHVENVLFFVCVRRDGRNKKRVFAKLTARPKSQHGRD